VRRVRRPQRRGGQLGAHQGCHVMRPVPWVAAPRGTFRSV
jgi:hypothetical protein